MHAIGIAAVLVHVSNWREATDWYERAFPDAVRESPDPADYGSLRLGGITIELVDADDRVNSGAAGSVVYWSVQNFDVALKHIQDLGAKLHRGPLAIEEGKRMCQVLDPWGNCIGLRGPNVEGEKTSEQMTDDQIALLCKIGESDLVVVPENRRRDLQWLLSAGYAVPTQGDPGSGYRLTAKAHEFLEKRGVGLNEA